MQRAQILLLTLTKTDELLAHDHDDCCEDHDHDHDHESEEHDHDGCCDEHCGEHGGKSVTIALLDAGVTNFETAGKTSFIDDATIDSEHGNDMMSVINEVAPEADVLDVRVLDDEGKGTYSTVEKGIRWSVDNNADIIVMSFVGEKSSALLESALAYAEEHEVLVVASAGNYSDNKALYPAAYPTVISVGALDENGNIQDYSNFSDYVDTYVEWNDGTSGAAQFIAAAAAVTMEQNPDVTVSELRASYNADKSVDIEAAKEENADTVVYSAATCKSHSYRWVTVRNATCTSSGLRQYKCSKCGRVANSSYPSALGHNYTAWTTTKKATCVANGSKKRTCSVCKKVETATIAKLSSTGHTFNGSYTTTKQPTCTTPGEKVGKCTKCGTVVTKITIPKTGHKYVYNSKTLSMKCSVCGKSYVAPASSSWEDYVKKSGVNYSKLSKADKETFAKNYLISKGCDATAVNISFEMGKNKKTLNVDNVDKLKTAMDRIDKFSKISGFEYADNLSAYLGYAAVGADAYVFFTTADGSYANVEKTLTSYINLSSDIVGYIPVVGSSYSKVIGGLVDPLNDMIKKVKKYNDSTVEAILIEGDASGSIEGFNGNYTDLSDPTVYAACVKYVDSMEGHDYQYAKDLLDHFIYSGMDKDVKAATGKSIEEIKKMAK